MDFFSIPVSGARRVPSSVSSLLLSPTALLWRWLAVEWALGVEESSVRVHREVGLLQPPHLSVGPPERDQSYREEGEVG